LQAQGRQDVIAQRQAGVRGIEHGIHVNLSDSPDNEPECCYGAPDFLRVAINAHRTVVATLEWAQQQSWVRGDRVILQGQSVGGMTTAAAAALNLPGFVGTINFAGGSGGSPERSPGKSCGVESLTEAYRRFGSEAKAPSLWLYAENDRFWGRVTPLAWHAAYRAGGSESTMIMKAPLEGRDGHQLLSQGAAFWAEPLEYFVKRVGLFSP